MSTVFVTQYLYDERLNLGKGIEHTTASRSSNPLEGMLA